MYYKITQEQEILRDTIREFAQAEIAPLASKIDWEAQVPNDLRSKLPNLGLYGITVPTESGGAGSDFSSLVIAIEELSKDSGSLGAQISFHNAVVCEAFRASTNSNLREEMLPKLASGKLGAFCFDEKSKKITCKIDGGELIVNGASDYVMSAGDASVFLILASLDGTKDTVLFGFEKSELAGKGFSVNEPKKLLGMRATGTARISFDQVRIPLRSLLHDVSKTTDFVSNLYTKSRLAVAAQALGLAQASIDAEVKYANQRTQFNTKIGKFYAVQDFIATDQVNLDTSRSLTYMVASEIETSRSLERDSAIAKISASNCAVTAARHAIRIHGGYGFIRDYPVERYMRDARLTQIYLESNEALKALVAKSLLES